MTKPILFIASLAILMILNSCASPSVAQRDVKKSTKMTDGRPPCLSIRDGEFGIEVDTMVMKIHNDAGVHSLLLSDGPPVVCKSLALVEGATISSVKIVFQMPNRKTDKLDEMIGVASLADAMWTTLPRVVAVRSPSIKASGRRNQNPKK